MNLKRLEIDVIEGKVVDFDVFDVEGVRDVDNARIKTPPSTHKYQCPKHGQP